MSICVVVKVGEGLVLASDSASTIVGAPVLPNGSPGPQGVIKIFFTGRKLYQLGRLPVGIMSWGAGSFRERTVASLVEEYENSEAVASLTAESLNVESVAEGLCSFMVKASDRFFGEVPREGRPATGLVVGGYSGDQFFPEVHVMNVPTSPPQRARPDKNGGPDLGANWYGIADAIVRFHHGRDDRVFAILKKHGVDDDVLAEIRAEIGREIQYPVLFNAMPLPDAVSYARFLVELTIARFRYVAGAELCGGPVNIATITRKEGFQAVS